MGLLQVFQGTSAPLVEPTAYLRLSGRPAVTPMEMWLAEELAGGEGQPRSRVIERIAQRSFRHELQHGAWAADAGVWGPAIYRREVAKTLQSLEGDFVETIAAGKPATSKAFAFRPTAGSTSPR